jgi:hypothetical protein
LIVKDKTAYVFVNEHYLATLDLSKARAGLDTLDLAGDVVVFTVVPEKVSKESAPKYAILELGSLDPNWADTDSPSVTGAWGDCRTRLGNPLSVT